MSEPRPIGELVGEVDLAAKQRAWLAERGVEVGDDDGPIDLVSPADKLERAWAKFAPAKFAHARLEHLAELDAQTFDDIAGWCASPTSNLMLLGPVGVGKTFAAFAVARHLMEAGSAVAWWPTVELFDGLRPDGGVDVDRPARAEYLLLDDLGGEKPSEWVAERLYLILNRRWLDGRPTIVTSNLEPAQLREVIGARTYDRLRDHAVAVRFAGASRRGAT